MLCSPQLLELSKSLHNFLGLTLCSNDCQFEYWPRFFELQSSQEVHALIICLLQQSVDPAVIPSHVAQRLQMSYHRTNHTYMVELVLNALNGGDRQTHRQKTDEHVSITLPSLCECSGMIIMYAFQYLTVLLSFMCRLHTWYSSNSLQVDNSSQPVLFIKGPYHLPPLVP